MLMAFSAMIISLMHVLVRDLSTEINPMEIAFFRNISAAMLTAPFALRQGRQALISKRPKLQLVRGFLGNIAMLTWFYALSILPVGDATALSFTAVIFTAIGAALFLRENVGMRRWAAIFIGLTGTLIILRPGVQAVSLGALVVIGSTVLWACTLLIVKVLGRTDSSITIVFYSSVYFTLFSFPVALYDWTWPTLTQLGLMVVIGGMAALGHFAIAEAMKSADTSVIVPLDFTRLLWAAGVGYLVFGEFPDFWTWVGGIVVFSSTVYISYREARARKRGV